MIYFHDPHGEIVVPLLQGFGVLSRDTSKHKQAVY